MLLIVPATAPIEDSHPSADRSSRGTMTDVGSRRSVDVPSVSVLEASVSLVCGVSLASLLGAVCILAVGSIGFLPTIASAETVTVNGVAGEAGLDGSFDEDGGAGENGGEAVASSGPLDARNVSTANGGDGGAGGAGGAPDGSGGAGGDGGLADAGAVSSPGGLTASADARAIGGDGGDGGLADSGGLGSGGDAGLGGTATATASSTSGLGSASSIAVSTGGAGGEAAGVGGRAGDGGQATATAIATGVTFVAATTELRGGRGGIGRSAADGGHGASVSLVDGSSTIVLSGPNTALNLNQTVRGGSGGLSEGGIAGNGGNAETIAVEAANTLGAMRMSLRSVGGAGGDATAGGTPGLGGNANAEAVGTGGGSVTVSATSDGGFGGDINSGNGSGRDGGAAIAAATGNSSTSSSLVSVSASAKAGRGGTARGVGQRGGDGGSATATASGTAGGMGNAFISMTVEGGRGGSGFEGADGGDGADAFAENAVTGEGGFVSLRQDVVAGHGGGSSTAGPVVGASGRGGDATSLLEAENAIGGLALQSMARAGIGAGAAHASGSATASGDVTVFVSSEAGAGGNSPGDVPSAIADGGQASLGPVWGASTGGGEVRAEARATSGGGGGGATIIGNGADAIVIDAVDGETSGSLSLIQFVKAGSASASFRDAGETGGRGGDATSDLTRSKSAESLFISVEAEAGGSNGAAATGGQLSGGNALVRANGRNDSGDIVIEYGAHGGNGSTSFQSAGTAGKGGSATSNIQATSSGDGNTVSVGLTDSSTVGGTGGGDRSFFGATLGGVGGAALSDVVGTAEGDSNVDIRSSAIGGVGGEGSRESDGGRGGLGGFAESRAVGRNAGSSSVNVLAVAKGGIGGGTRSIGNTLGGDGGLATASARGESTGGGNVTVTARATGGAGDEGGTSADVVLTDSVSGSTTGLLRLIQEANGGSAFGVDGGSAVSTIRAVDEDGGTLEIESIARAGDGVVAGSARASATGTGQDDVHITARARGGSGIFAGEVAVESVFGESLGGGSVSVVAEATGGHGFFGTGSEAPGAGRGADVLVDNAVDGRTSGLLQLTQSATGGDAGAAGTSGVLKSAGTAMSRLDRVASAGEVVALVEATGGRGSGLDFQSLDATTAGGQAIADVFVSNDAGRATSLAYAEGGRGGLGRADSASGAGGDATVRATASTLNAGHDVVVGGSGTFGAVGGLSARGGPTSQLSETGDGGDADSRSMGMALADSHVSVHDRATGGTGFNGGAALSHAEGHNIGSENVEVLAEAIGGTANRPGGLGGEALASARGTSTSGDVFVTALVTAGANGFRPAGSEPVAGVAARLVDAVDGSTAGVLSLTQRAMGGPGSASSDSIGGSGGAAESSLSATNTGGGDLVLISEAVGGETLAGLGMGGSASASARGVGLGDSSVDVLATSRGGNGNPPDFRSTGSGAGDGGVASLGGVSAESVQGGAVRVRGEAFGGRGGRIGGNGAAVVVVDAVSGSTTGELTLEQLAAGGAGAVGGFASSRLDREVDASAFVVALESRGGDSREDVTQTPTAVAGDAESILRARNNAGSVEAFALARGGNGFDSFSRNGSVASNGGGAISDAYARTIGDGHDVTLGDSLSFPDSARSGAYGGDGGSLSTDSLLGGSGGQAVSVSEAIADGDSAVEVFDRAIGGDGGTSSAETGAGGAASSMASGRNAGAASVVVIAEARGGDAGFNFSTTPGSGPIGPAGTAVARAIGFSESGNVIVTATQRGGKGSTILRGTAGRGADSEAIDAVSGGTTGLLTLSQTAIGGDGGSGLMGGAGGNARSELDAANARGGALSARLEAIGGTGGNAVRADSFAGQGGDAFISGGISSSGSAALSLSAHAVGGMGGDAATFPDGQRDGADGGRAEIGSLLATSLDGGRIELIAEAIGGNGGSGTRSGGTGGSGRSVRLQDVAQGSTGGDLVLVQRATGGNAGLGTFAGQAGDALSQFGVDASSARLELTSVAMGGLSAAGGGRGGGAATSIVDSINRGGRSTIRARADGGSQALVFTGSTAFTGGGTASVTVHSESSFAGQDIQIGEVYSVDVNDSAMGAFGGNGGAGSFGVGGGGNATSVSVGAALSDSQVAVWDLAVGGRSDGIPSVNAQTDGGDASSRASALTGGTATATANAMALGGDVRFRGSEWRTGSAVAEAYSQGRGEANATAISRIGSAGNRSGLSTAGLSVAHSIARASGTSGRVEAIAEGKGGEVGLVSAFRTFASAGVSVGSTASAAANAGGSARDALLSNADAASFISGAHTRSDEWGRVGLNLNSSQVGPEIMLRTAAGFGDDTSPRDSLDGIFVSFLDVEIDGDEFSELFFRIENSGDVVLERAFGQADEAIRFFSSILDLGDFDDLLNTTVIDLRFSIERADSTLGERFGTVFAVGTVAVPEPGTGLLLVTGLIILASRRASRAEC